MFGKEGVFRGKSEDYLGAATIKEIEMPEGMESKPLEPYYYIPRSLATDEFGDPIDLTEYVVPRPLSLKSEKGEVGIKIQKLGEKRWIHLNASPTQIWPRTQNFFSEKGIRINRTNVRKGVIETADFEHPDFANVVSRFRVYIEKGLHAESTEITMIQVGREKGLPFDTSAVWPQQSHNSELEAVFLKELAQTLSVNVNNKSASLLGQDVGGDTKSYFLKGLKEPAMALRLTPTRSIAVLKRSLKVSEFTLWDSTSDNAIFYVGYLPEGEKAKFYKRMFGMGSKVPETPKVPLTDALQNLDASDQVKMLFDQYSDIGYSDAIEAKQGFLVVLRKGEQHNTVYIRDPRGRPVEPDLAKDMLNLLRKNLI